MKPNLIVVQTAHSQINADIEQFLERFCDSHYVYLIRPGSGFREDSAVGLRFLSHSLDQLPDIVDVDAVISVGDPVAAGRLRESYPGSPLAVWDPEDRGCLPDLLVRLLAPSIVHADFRPSGDRDLARAI